MIHRLLAFDAWANREALASLRALPAPPADAVRVLAHLAAAQQVWWERIEGLPQSLPVWPALDLEEAAALLAAGERRWRDLAAALGPDDEGRVVAYANTRGDRFESRLGDILTHVVLHGAHHRGQIATAVRGAGGTPAVTDFIHAVRSRSVD